MEDKKSLSSNNQVFENYDGIFQPSENFFGDRSALQVKQYGRDTLLQLRLHPTSLRKPKNLPEMEVIKNKLYLHDITETTPTKAGKCMAASNNQKPECGNMKLEYPLLSHHLNRLYSYCYSHMANGSYQSVPSKLRPVVQAYCNPLKKYCVSNNQCPKDFNVEEYLWAKHHFTSPDDLWSCYPSHTYSSVIRNKDQLESVPKCKKKLQIIDPATGENILESLIPTQSEKIKACYVDEHCKSPKDDTAAINEEKQTENHFRNDDLNKETSMYATSDSSDRSNVNFHDDNACHENTKGSDTLYKTDFYAKLSDVTFNTEEVNEFRPTVDTTKKENSINAKDKTETTEKCELEEKIYELSKDAKKIFDNESGHNLADTIAHMDVQPQGVCQDSLQRECNEQVSKESIIKENDSMQDSLRQLREKVYVVKQEQQKMAILQSFLRYKQYQLEESARNLDEKRIDIANWERNLYNKAKKLQEKDQWLENKNELLENKAQQLAEKERHLNEEENKMSGDTSFTKNIIDETQPSVKKFSLDNCCDSAWNEINKNRGNSEYSYLRCFTDKSQIPDSSISNTDKRKSDIYSIEDLERSIASIKKIHSSDEISGSSTDNKAEPLSLKNIPKKDEKPYEQFIMSHISKGRLYLPEHIKHWLDKNAL